MLQISEFISSTKNNNHFEHMCAFGVFLDTRFFPPAQRLRDAIRKRSKKRKDACAGRRPWRRATLRILKRQNRAMWNPVRRIGARRENRRAHTRTVGRRNSRATTEPHASCLQPLVLSFALYRPFFHPFTASRWGSRRGGVLQNPPQRGRGKTHFWTEKFI